MVAVTQRYSCKYGTKNYELYMAWWETCSDMNWLQMNYNDKNERKSQYTLDREQWKTQKSFELDEDNSEDYNIQ